MESLWRKEAGEIRSWNSQGKSVKEYATTKYDVIVVGAGMAGILTAYYLQEAGKRVLVLEAKTIASGQTDGTTAKITSQHGLKYSRLLNAVGLEAAKLYAQANEEAIEEYERLISQNSIECQFERTTAYLYATEDERPLKEEVRAANLMGIDAFYTEKTELPVEVLGAAGFRNQACFQPLEFMKTLCEKLTVLEHVKVQKIKGNKVITGEAVFTAGKIVVATHYPIKNVPGFYFLRQHQERSYCVALSGCKEMKGMYLGIDGEELSFRGAGEYLLLGGCSHRTGKEKRCYAKAKLEEYVKKYYPKAQIEAFWAAQDGMPHDGIPFIGKYSIFAPHLYVATGFQKWGMTSSMVAALLLRDAICGIISPYSKVFTPLRMNLRAGIRDFLTDVGESVKGLTCGAFVKKAPRCAHLGCGLHWNAEEESWDCPCHGSRYDKKGKIIDNPTVRNLDYKL